jgi:uncharacterized membrane protein YdjX (TVP38/TMEM64 family)
MLAANQFQAIMIDAPATSVAVSRVSRVSRFARRWAPAALLLGGLCLILFSGAAEQLAPEALAAHSQFLQALVAREPVLAAGLYMLVYAVATAVSLPGGAVLTLIGGWLFGVWFGGFYAVIGATVGAIAVFLAAKTALGDVLLRRAGPRATQLLSGFRRDALGYLLVLRLIPLFPFWLVNLVPALAGVGLGTYTLATVLGILPGTMVYAGLGNGLGTVLDAGHLPHLGVLLAPSVLFPLLGLSALALLPVIYRRWRGRKHG